MAAGIPETDDSYAVRVGWRDLARAPSSFTREQRQIAEMIERLPEPWVAVHALPLDGRPGAVDHLVIGMGGVLAIGSKENPDAASWAAGMKFLLLVQRRPYIAAAGRTARRAAECLRQAAALPVTVTGVLAVEDRRKDFHVHFEDEGVHVVGRRHLADWIEGLPPVLTEDQVETLHRVARRSDTWR